MRSLLVPLELLTTYISPKSLSSGSTFTLLSIYTCASNDCRLGPDPHSDLLLFRLSWLKFNPTFGYLSIGYRLPWQRCVSSNISLPIEVLHSFLKVGDTTFFRNPPVSWIFAFHYPNPLLSLPIHEHSVTCVDWVTDEGVILGVSCSWLLGEDFVWLWKNPTTHQF